ncbi:MAG: hypothetical protein RL618_931, partial [Pseudomonadota bacterium]
MKEKQFQKKFEEAFVLPAAGKRDGEH